MLHFLSCYCPDTIIEVASDYREEYLCILSHLLSTTLSLSLLLRFVAIFCVSNSLNLIPIDNLINLLILLSSCEKDPLSDFFYFFVCPNSIFVRFPKIFKPSIELCLLFLTYNLLNSRARSLGILENNL